MYNASAIVIHVAFWLSQAQDKDVLPIGNDEYDFCTRPISGLDSFRKSLVC